MAKVGTMTPRSPVRAPPHSYAHDHEWRRSRSVLKPSVYDSSARRLLTDLVGVHAADERFRPSDPAAWIVPSHTLVPVSLAFVPGQLMGGTGTIRQVRNRSHVGHGHRRDDADAGDRSGAEPTRTDAASTVVGPIRPSEAARTSVRDFAALPLGGARSVAAWFRSRSEAADDALRRRGPSRPAWCTSPGPRGTR